MHQADGETVVAHQRLAQRRQVGRGDLDHRAAGAADGVMVFGAGAHGLKAGRLSFQAQLADQPLLAQKDQIAVDRGEVHLGRLGAHPLIDLIGRQMPVAVVDHIQHQGALRRQPHPGPAQLVDDVLVARHENLTASCKDLQLE